jgi:hypothetical protein
VEYCHCNTGVGLPLTTAVNVVSCPALMVTFAGDVVKENAASTVSVAAPLILPPAELLTTQRYCMLFMVVVTTVRVSVAPIAPGMAVQMAPLLEDCH